MAAEDYRDGRPWKSLVANRLATFGSGLLVKKSPYRSLRGFERYGLVSTAMREHNAVGGSDDAI